MRRHVTLASLLLLGIGLLAGCGQKGPLFLPARSAVTSPAAAAPAPATSAAQPAGAATPAPAPATSRG